MILALALLAARPFALEDTVSMKTIGEVAVSPDGGTILHTVTSVDLAANKSRSVVEGAAGFPEGASMLAWNRQGTEVAFVAKFGAKQMLAVWTKATGAVREVCEYRHSNAYLAHARNRLVWSGDGSQIAFAGSLEDAPPAGDPLVITRILYKSRKAFSDNRRTQVLVVNAKGGTPRAVTSGDSDEHSLDWAAGGEIVFLSNRAPDADARLNYDLYALNPETGLVRQITRTPGVEQSPRVAPDGRTIAYVATTRALTTIDSVAEDAHLFTVPLAGGPARRMNAAQDRRTSGPRWSADGGHIFYTVMDSGKVALYRMSAGGGTPEPVVNIEGVVTAHDSGVAAIATPTSPGELYRTGARLEPLTSLNPKDAFVLSAPRRVGYSSFDGTPVEGWLYPALGNGGRSPMILSIHGGPHSMANYGFNAVYQHYAARGYAVLSLNPRGSAGYGQKFADGCRNDWGGGDYKDLMAGVDHVLKTHPEIDAARLGVTGGSYGGFMTNWVVTETRRFKGAVAVASLSNLISFYATSLYQDLVHVEFNGFPWEGRNFETLWRWSPLRKVAQVTTPVLLLHGEADNDVHITQAEELYTALRYRGVDSALVRYPREGHGFDEPRHRVDALRRTVEWMDKYVRGVANAGRLTGVARGQ